MMTQKIGHLTLWYTDPARQWVEALPVGNGRLGAMIYGGVPEEHIQFNEDSVWTGKPHDYTHPGAADQFPVLRNDRANLRVFGADDHGQGRGR